MAEVTQLFIIEPNSGEEVAAVEPPDKAQRTGSREDQWWQEVEDMIKNDSDFFAHAPAIADLTVSGVNPQPVRRPG